MSHSPPRSLRRATVVVPPLRDFYFTRHRFSSLGAVIVAGMLRRENATVDYLNFPLMRPKGVVAELPPDLSYLRHYLVENETGKLSFFTAFRHFGPPVDECAKMIVAARPEACFFSVFAFCYADDAIELARAVRKLAPGLLLVVGGAGPSAYPGYFLADGEFDYVLAGEAEASLVPFIKALVTAAADAARENRLSTPQLRSAPNAAFERVPNCFWKEDGRVRSSGLTAYAGGADMEFALVKSAESSRSVTFSTMLSRGCPKTCAFCSSRLTFGSAFRSVPLDKIAEALRSVSSGDVDEKQVVVNIEDDNFLADADYFGSAATLFKNRFPGARFIAENGIDHSFLTPGTCEWLIKLGMTKFNLSVASLEALILAANSRSVHLQRYEMVLAILDKKGIPAITYFICGFTEDTTDTIAHTLRYLANQRTLAGISLFYAVPGMSGFTDTAVFGAGSSYRCCGSAAFPWNGSLSTDTMITAFRLSRLGNLLKSGALSEKEKNLAARIVRTRELHTLVKDKKGGERIVPVERLDRELVRSYFAEPAAIEIPKP
jgi:hypothetical protein